MKVGILGTGHIGNVHARQYGKMPDVTVGYRDHSPDRMETFGQRWEATPFDSAEALIEWADVVDICLPTDLHPEFAHKAISARKAVFIEKPITRCLEDATSILEAADKAGVPLMVGQVVRFFPEYSRGHELVQRGAVGTPAAARMRRGGAAPTGSHSWFMDHSRSGGVLIDLAIHDFDWLRWTLGEVEFLYSRSVGAKTGFGPDYALTTLTFESGAVAHVESTWMDPGGFRTTFEVAGSEGLIEFDSRSVAAIRTQRTGDTKLESPLADLDDPYYLELSGFLTSIRNGTPPPVLGRDGVAALALALAAVESAKTGKVIYPPKI